MSATKLESLAKMAGAVRGAEFADALAPAQRRSLNEMATAIRKTLADMDVAITADTLMALIAGAQMQVTMAGATNPVQPVVKMLLGSTDTINEALSIVFGLLAADLLDGSIA